MAFKMKGHTLPGIKQLKSNDLDDGRSGSAAFQQSDPFAGSKKGKYDEGETSDIAEVTVTTKAPHPPFVDYTTKYPDIGELNQKEHSNLVEKLPNDVFKNNKNTGDGTDIDADKYNRFLGTL